MVWPSTDIRCQVDDAMPMIKSLVTHGEGGKYLIPPQYMDIYKISAFNCTQENAK